MAVESYSMPRVTAVGSAGSGAGTQTSAQPLSGLLLAIGVSQGNTPHANTDITITCEFSGKARTLLTLTNYPTTTLTWYDVHEQFDDTVGAAISGAYGYPPLAGLVTVTVAQGGSAATCDVTLVFAGGM